MTRPRVRIGTLMLLVVIAALAATLIARERAANRREAILHSQSKSLEAQLKIARTKEFMAKLQVRQVDARVRLFEKLQARKVDTKVRLFEKLQASPWLPIEPDPPVP